MSRQVFLHDDTIDLVLLDINDASLLVGWFNNLATTQFLARGHILMDLEEEREYLKNLKQTETNLQLGIWHRNDAILIGTCGLHRIHTLNRTAEFGIVIGDATYHGRGFGTRTLQLLLDYAFRVRDLRNVTLRVLGNNPRAQRCYEKCGFVQIGRYPRHIFKQGTWYDDIHMMVNNPLAT